MRAKQPERIRPVANLQEFFKDSVADAMDKQGVAADDHTALLRRQSAHAVRALRKTLRPRTDGPGPPALALLLAEAAAAPDLQARNVGAAARRRYVAVRRGLLPGRFRAQARRRRLLHRHRRSGIRVAVRERARHDPRPRVRRRVRRARREIPRVRRRARRDSRLGARGRRPRHPASLRGLVEDRQPARRARAPVPTASSRARRSTRRRATDPRDAMRLARLSRLCSAISTRSTSRTRSTTSSPRTRTSRARSTRADGSSTRNC